MSDSELIDELGGPAVLAGLLGYEKLGGVQRVHNWKVRGIPARVKLQWPHLFLRQMAPAAASCMQQAAFTAQPIHSRAEQSSS